MVATLTNTRRWLLVALALAWAGCGPAEVDSDGDGYADERDCDPGDPSVHPGAADTWGDDRDDNCDGTDGTDADGDGFAVDADPASQAPDCDDDDPGSWPGRPWEDPGDGIDEDCDGTDGSSAEASRTAWVAGSDDAGTGWGIAGGGDLDGDGVPDLLVGSPSWNGGVGRVLAYSGSSLLGAGELTEEEADYRILGSSTHPVAMGSSVAFLGDRDGDGRDEVLAGGMYWVPAAAWLTFSSELDAETEVEVEDVALQFSDEAHPAMGSVVAASPRGSVLLGAPTDISGSSGGYIFEPQPDWPDEVGAEDASAAIEIPGEQGFGEWGLALADVDGDGLDDAVLAQPGLGVGIALGASLQEEEVVTVLDHALLWPEPFWGAGRSAARIGDVDGDGADEIAIGGPQDVEGGPGLAYVVGSRLLAGHDEAELSEVGVLLTGQEDGDGFGVAVAGGGDVDGDDIPDLLVVGEAKQGRLWVFSGVDLAAALDGGPTPGARATFAFAEAPFGLWMVRGLSILGDVDGDGVQDIAVGYYDEATRERGVSIILGYAGD